MVLHLPLKSTRFLTIENEQSTLFHYSVVGGVTSVISDILTATWRDLPLECFQPMGVGGGGAHFPLFILTVLYIHKHRSQMYLSLHLFTGLLSLLKCSLKQWYTLCSKLYVGFIFLMHTFCSVLSR
jgi:hypothetical protein